MLVILDELVRFKRSYSHSCCSGWINWSDPDSYADPINRSTAFRVGLTAGRVHSMAFTDRSCMRTRPALEQLEDRAVPATVVSQLIGAQLIVTGTQGPDRIRVDTDANQQNVIVRSFGQEIGRYPIAAVSEVLINGQAGNDIIAVAPSIKISTVIAGGDDNDILQAGTGNAMVSGDGGVINRVMGGNGTNLLVSGSGNDVLGGGAGKNDLVVPGSPTGTPRLFGYSNKDTIIGAPGDFTSFLGAQSPPDLTSTLGLQPSPVVQQLAAQEVQALLDRASAATPSNDGIIAVVDRSGRILGVKVESGVDPDILNNTANLVFAIDGAVAIARTGAMFGNMNAPLTSRTIQYISQSTITQREIESNPSITDPNSTLRGPGTVAPLGIGNHFPPGVPFTPQVDLFGIEYSNRDTSYHPSTDRIHGTADDQQLLQRFNVDSAFIPSSIPESQQLAAIDSYGYASGIMPGATPRGIGTLPGGIPITRTVTGSPLPQVVGGIGVFFPGKTGFATESNCSLSSDYNPSKPDRTLEAEFMSYAALGGTTVSLTPSINPIPFPGAIGGVEPVSGVVLATGRIDLVGITLPIFGPNPSDAFPGANGAQFLVQYGLSLGGIQNAPNSGAVGPSLAPGGFARLLDPGSDNKINPNPATVPGIPVPGLPVDTTQVTFLPGTPVPEGFLVTPHAGSALSAPDVQRILAQGVQQAVQIRSAIRLPLNEFSRMTIAVTDTNGDVLGLFRMPDGTTFSLDIAVAKARNVDYYADPTLLQSVDQLPGLPAGIAFTNRTFRFLALPRYPEGIDGAPPGYFSQLNDGGINPTTGAIVGAPLPATAFQSVFGFAAFHPQSNFRDPANILNQNGVVFFPGAVPLYSNNKLVGGLGISGDGVDQDDVVTSGAKQGFDTLPDGVLRADLVFFRDVRLPFQKFNRQPRIT